MDSLACLQRKWQPQNRQGDNVHERDDVKIEIAVACIINTQLVWHSVVPLRRLISCEAILHCDRQCLLLIYAAHTAYMIEKLTPLIDRLRWLLNIDYTSFFCYRAYETILIDIHSWTRRCVTSVIHRPQFTQSHKRANDDETSNTIGRATIIIREILGKTSRTMNQSRPGRIDRGKIHKPYIIACDHVIPATKIGFVLSTRYDASESALLRIHFRVQQHCLFVQCFCTVFSFIRI